MACSDEVLACPKCGGTSLSRLKGASLKGRIFRTNCLCLSCGYDGIPLLFDSREEYKKFLHESRQGL